MAQQHNAEPGILHDHDLKPIVRLMHNNRYVTDNNERSNWQGQSVRFVPAGAMPLGNGNAVYPAVNGNYQMTNEGFEPLYIGSGQNLVLKYPACTLICDYPGNSTYPG